jgi:hypothetical protein
MFEAYSEIMHLVILSTLWCVGFYMVSRVPGDALYFVHNLTATWPAVLRKPIVHCINCMASLHSLIIMCLYFWLWDYFPPIKTFLIEWLIVTIITAGTNGIVWAVYRYFELMITPIDSDGNNEATNE